MFLSQQIHHNLIFLADHDDYGHLLLLTMYVHNNVKYTILGRSWRRLLYIVKKDSSSKPSPRPTPLLSVVQMFPVTVSNLSRKVRRGNTFFFGRRQHSGVRYLMSYGLKLPLQTLTWKIQFMAKSIQVQPVDQDLPLLQLLVIISIIYLVLSRNKPTKKHKNKQIILLFLNFWTNSKGMGTSSIKEKLKCSSKFTIITHAQELNLM
jgi:hypothetical protein